VYSIRLLGIAERRTGLNTFEDLARHLLGPFWDRFTTFIMVSFNWGSSIAYIIAMIKVFAPILEANIIKGDAETWGGYWGARLITIGVWAAIMLPMAVQRELNTLRHASMFSIVAITYFILCIVGHAVADGKTAVTTLAQLDPWVLSNEMIVGITLIMFAYSCQSNVFEVFGEMSPRAVSTLTQSSGISVAISFLLYMLAGWFGYVNFGRAVSGAVLDEYHPRRNPAMMVAFLCLAIKLCTSFLLCMHPTRDSVLYTANWGSYMTVAPLKRIAVTVVLCVLALLCGLFIPSITVVFSLLGGVGGAFLGFLFPAMFCIFSGAWTPQNVGWFDFIGAWAFVFLGCLCCSFGVVASVYQITNPL
jgi:amino acid permease